MPTSSIGPKIVWFMPPPMSLTRYLKADTLENLRASDDRDRLAKC